MYTDFEPSMEQQKKWYRQISEDASRKDWVINVDDEDVGLLSIVKIDRTNRRCEWAYYLGSPNVRGKGIGKNVEMNVLEYVLKNGEYLDIVEMGILREDWEKNVRNKHEFFKAVFE